MIQFNIKKLSRIIITLLFIASLIAIYWFISNHGFIDITNDEKTSLRYARSDQPESKTDSSNSKRVLIRSGEYSLELSSSNGKIIKNVSVPNFLQSVSIGAKSITQKKVHRIASNAQPHILPNENSYVSLSISSNLLENVVIHAKNDPFGLNNKLQNASYPKMFKPVVYGENQILYFDSQVENSVDTNQLKLYDNGRVVSINSDPYASNQDQTIYTSRNDQHNSFVVQSGGKSGKYYYHKDLSSQPLEFAKNIDSFSLNGTLPIAAISGNYAAVLSGANFDPPYTEDPGEPGRNIPPEQETVLHIFSLNNQEEIAMLNLGKVANVSEISVSPSGEYAIITRDSRLEVYSTTLKSKVLTIPFAVASDIVWISDTSALYSTPNQGVFEINAANNESHSIFPSTEVSSDNLFVKNNKDVIFTGFSSIETDDNLTPDAYIILNNITADDSNQLLKKLPYTTTEFSITSLEDVIYIQTLNQIGSSGLPLINPEGVDSIKKRALEYIEKNLNNSGQYKILYL